MATYDRTADRLDTVAESPVCIPGHRFDDGRCGRRGRFWVGTMRDDVTRAPEGVLYRLEPGGVVLVLDEIRIPNSLAWSPDGRTMSFADSSSGTIRRYAFDPDTGAMESARPFAVTTPPGFPDGSTVDADDFFWDAAFNGGRIVRYAPDGRVARAIAVPVPCPTSCAFGGPGSNTLSVTTASRGMTPDEPGVRPSAGAPPAFERGVRGIAGPRRAGVEGSPHAVGGVGA